MNKHRMLFKKDGLAIYISHLDLMRTMQRVFIRSGISIKHTEGFNPHPFISIALPLSVGCSSQCELMDFEITDNTALSDVPVLMNKVMPSGIEVLEVYEAQRKLKEIAWLEISGSFEYDHGLPDNCVQKLSGLFSADELIIQKKSKKGITNFDIIPCINAISFAASGSNRVAVNAVISPQNPSLNPNNLLAAIEIFAAELNPDFAEFHRVEVYDSDFHVFR